MFVYSEHKSRVMNTGGIDKRGPKIFTNAWGKISQIWKKKSTIYAGGQANRRPVSAYCTSATGKQPHNNNRGQDQDQLQVDKPVLRRERTFDLDPKPNNAATTKIVEVNIDQPIDLHDEASNGEIFNTNGNDNVADGQTLQMFQQQRLYHTMRYARN